MKATGDVTVLGMVMGIHMLEDIGIGVPQGMLVTVPAEQALRSRDLWRAISQKQVFRIHSGPHQAPMVVPPSVSEPVPSLIEENQQLRAQHAEVMALLKSQAAAIAALTAAVSTAPRIVVPAGQADGVDSSAPAFIPATIKPDSAEVRIESQREESEGTDISSNRDKLRRFRQ